MGDQNKHKKPPVMTYFACGTYVLGQEAQSSSSLSVHHAGCHVLPYDMFP